MNLLLRVILVLVGLVVAASLVVAGTLLFAAWGARAVWARLTGRPVTPFIVRMHPFGAFDQMRRGRPEAARAARAEPTPPARREIGDVTDVEPRPPARAPDPPDTR